MRSLRLVPLALAVGFIPPFQLPMFLPWPVYVHEFPHPPTTVSFHPRKDQPFTLAQLDEALRAGVHGVELDLRWRSADSSVVCSHEKRDLASRPTLGQALTAIRHLHAAAATVHGDGLQFFLFLDLKDESPEFHHALMRVLWANAGWFANSLRANAGPRPITVVLTGSRAAIEGTIPRLMLDMVCVIEGRDYGGRIHDLSDRGATPHGAATFQWLAVEYPTERSRVRGIHGGYDSRARGRFNVRVIGARGHVARAIDSGADAVNADLDEIPAAVRHAEKATVPSLH
jgi:hypothetical protein